MARCEDYPCCGHGEFGCESGRAHDKRQASRSSGRFDNYQTIKAKYASIGACGHGIKVGNRIGYSRKYGCMCASCWTAWSQENAEAAFDERQMAYAYDSCF